MADFLSVYGGVVGATQHVVDGHIEVVCQCDQGGIIGLAFFSLISADAVLVEIQLHGKCDL